VLFPRLPGLARKNPYYPYHLKHQLNRFAAGRRFDSPAAQAGTVPRIRPAARGFAGRTHIAFARGLDCLPSRWHCLPALPNRSNPRATGLMGDLFCVEGLVLILREPNFSCVIRLLR